MAGTVMPLKWVFDLFSSFPTTHSESLCNSQSLPRLLPSSWSVHLLCIHCISVRLLQNHLKWGQEVLPESPSQSLSSSLPYRLIFCSRQSCAQWNKWAPQELSTQTSSSLCLCLSIENTTLAWIINLLFFLKKFTRQKTSLRVSHLNSFSLSLFAD